MADLSKRIAALMTGMALTVAACSGSDVEPIEEGLDTETSEATTATTASSTTTSTEATTTTLSELELAEAEVEEIAVSWHQLTIDTSNDNEERFEPLTGLQLQKVRDYAAELEAAGEILRTREPAPIEVIDVRVDLESGLAEVDACTGFADDFLDAETLELLFSTDPAETTTSFFELQLIDGEWKISGWFPSDLTADGPVSCEITP